MSLPKIHRKIPWRNRTEPALNERNLEQYDHELDTLDDRIINLHTTKMDAQTAGNFITNFTINPVDGVITITYYSGRVVTYDTNLEKIPFNYRFDETSQILYIISDDGTEKVCNLSSLISQYEFRDSDTIVFPASNGVVTAQIKKGSVTEELLQPNFLADTRIAAAQAEAAAESAAEAANNTEAARIAMEKAVTSTQDFALQAKSSAGIAAEKAETSADSALTAKESADRAKESETAAVESKEAAATSAEESSVNANASADSASSAATSAAQAGEQALLAKSYSVGTEGAIRPGDTTDNARFFSELAQKLTEDAQKLLDQAQKLVSAATAGSIIPAGTVMFEDLPEDPKIGYMYNISNSFTTDSRFTEGAGTYYNPGANIYWTKDGQWDVMIGVQVTGVKGAAEDDYHQGNVNITPASIGLGNVNNTADADKVVKAADKTTKDGNGRNIVDTYLEKTGDSKNNIVTFTSEDTSSPINWTDMGLIASGEKHSNLWHRVSVLAKNARYLFKLIGNSQLSVGDGTVIGAINALNTGIKLKIFHPVFVPNTYVQEYSLSLQLRAGLHVANIGIVLIADMQPWSTNLIANISDWDGGYMLFPIVSTQGNNEAFSQTLLIQINQDGTMYMSSHGKITNRGWFFGTAVS